MCHGGTLEDLVKSRKEGLTEKHAAAFMVKLLETTQFIHGKGWFQQATSSTLVRYLKLSRNAYVRMALQVSCTTI